MTHRKANMWRTTAPVTAPARAGVRLHAAVSPVGVSTPQANNPRIATNLVEQRFGNRADRAIRKFSWEDGE